MIPEHIVMLLEVLNTDPWNEHLAGNPIAKELGCPGQCVEVMKNLVRAKFGIPLVNTTIPEDPVYKLNGYGDPHYDFRS